MNILSSILIKEVSNNIEKEHILEQYSLKLYPNNNININNIITDFIALENQRYTIWFQIDSVDIELGNFKNDFKVNLYLNDTLFSIQNIDITSPNLTQFKNETLKELPFHLQYDLVRLSVHISSMSSKIDLWYHAPLFLCKTRHEADATNIANILDFLSRDTSIQVNEWMVHPKGENEFINVLYRASLATSKVKSISSYIFLLNKTINTFSKQLRSFHGSSNSKLQHTKRLSPVEEVKAISINDLDWLGKNSHLLSQVTKSAIRINGKYFLPKRMQHSKSINNHNTYENQIIVAFMNFIRHNLSKILFSILQENNKISEFINQFTKHEKIASTIPIITAKKIHLSNSNKIISDLKSIKKKLVALIANYKSCLRCDNINFTTWPKYTKTFQEVKHYNEIFNLIIEWRSKGDFTNISDNLILKARRFDKLYEFFCLSKILLMFKNRGFKLKDNRNIFYNYKINSNFLDDDLDIGNTYHLFKDNMNVIVYYQPYIHTSFFENDLTLFRSSKGNAFRPDFVLKFFDSNDDKNAMYAILDAKYTGFTNAKNHYLQNIIYKYGIQIQDYKKTFSTTKFIWILNGRVESDLSKNSIYRLHTSNLLNSSPCSQSIGIYPLISSWDHDNEILWNELIEQFTFLK